MNVEPMNWNVVVVGYWNPAILTPAGIGRRLFGLPEGTPVLVEVPLEGLFPHRVKHDDLTVTAEMGRLVVSADTPTYVLLDRAKEVAARAIEKLPETPLTAAGYNVRLRIGDPSDELLAATACEIDDLLSDAEFSIESWNTRRVLKMDDGVLNLSIEKDKDVTVELNFHRPSTKPDELVTWLKRPIIEVEKTVSLVLEKVVRAPAEGIGK